MAKYVRRLIELPDISCSEIHVTNEQHSFMITFTWRNLNMVLRIGEKLTKPRYNMRKTRNIIDCHTCRNIMVVPTRPMK